MRGFDDGGAQTVFFDVWDFVEKGPLKIGCN